MKLTTTERGLAVTAVELGPQLAALARRRLTEYPAAEVVTRSMAGHMLHEARPAPYRARHSGPS